jgi:hypothetical protein
VKILDLNEYSIEYEKFKKITRSFIKRSKSSDWIECVNTMRTQQKLEQLKTWNEINCSHIDKSKMILLIDSMVSKLSDFNFNKIDIKIDRKINLDKIDVKFDYNYEI